ncbi:glycosyltransferase [Syntrophotalea carbinolica DSM 2380]|uniref:Glycosyltransferase n=1 Tax=Syntrophotalea carbinolica (strain DSM 2380 / NBRC 103641 / GraBd1) TaxID=338963 RepID=Q3A1C7_SYNC1|nr:glycosyltransferase [Syntrophotalea carbinolica]ABA89830.1 glycosyltransferase [Syntrophotalea carbinolica DSM 2380]
MKNVSICIPSYNSEKYINQTIDSVLCQLYKNYEIIIVDDKSSDNTREIISNYAIENKSIKFYTNDSNLGIVGNFNKCLSLCKGKYIKYLLADDLFLTPDCLGRFVDALESHPNVSLVSSGRQLIDSQSNVIGEAVSYAEGVYSPGKEIIKDCLLYFKNKIGEPTSVIFRRDALKRGFKDNYRQVLDLEMWFHLLENGDLYYIKDKLVGFRIHEEQTTQKNKNGLVYFSDVPLLLNDYCHKPYIRFGRLIKTLILIKFGEKAFKLYKNGRINFYDMKRIINHDFSFFTFIMLRPFYKFVKNILRLKFLR